VSAPINYNPADAGCLFEGCGSQDTVTLSRLGRRCADHPPLFDPTTAVEMVRDGWTDTAMSYVRWSS